MRAFRHTCTLIGMTLVTSLIDIAKMVQMDLENTERQLETELKKGQAKRAFAKVILSDTNVSFTHTIDRT